MNVEKYLTCLYNTVYILTTFVYFGLNEKFYLYLVFFYHILSRFHTHKIMATLLYTNERFRFVMVHIICSFTTDTSKDNLYYTERVNHVKSVTSQY